MEKAEAGWEAPLSDFRKRGLGLVLHSGVGVVWVWAWFGVCWRLSRAWTVVVGRGSGVGLVWAWCGLGLGLFTTAWHIVLHATLCVAVRHNRFTNYV